MDALELCVREIQAVAADVRAHPVSDEAFKAFLRRVLMKYYKGHTIEILGQLEAQHDSKEFFGCEGTD
jgi:hypothetical protein